MNLIGRALLFAGATALTVLAAQTMPVRAQTAGQPAATPPGAVPGTAQSAPQPKASKAPTGGKAASKPATETAEPARTDGGSQLRQRIDQLEEQVTEMHVAVGTLESLAKTGAGRASNAPAPTGGMVGDASVRLDGLENRLRTLTGQIEQMGQQIRALEARGGRSSPDRTDAVPSAAPGTRAAEARPADQPPASERVGDRGGDRGADRGSDRSDGIGGLIRGPGSDRSADVGAASLPPIGSPTSSPQPRQQPASLTTSGNPRETYERAYGSLLRQDYASAEIGFAEFLSQFPSHELSGNAQYWLGESFYVRGQYKPAANAFLKGYQTYPKSQKGPDSLLKLGMSLDKLGQRDAACSSIGELGARFPSAPAHILNRAQSERARLGC
jgi:tol-pal system protein YbgF